MGKAFEKQTKTRSGRIGDQGEKQIKAIQDNNKQLANIQIYFPENILNDEAKKEMDKILEIEKTVDSEKLVYKTSQYEYSFQNFLTIRSFGRDIYDGEITLKEANEDQESLVDEIKKFSTKTKPRSEEKKREKEDVLKNLHNFYDGREKVLDAFASKIFPIKALVI